MSIPIIHHYVPQHVLRRFCDSDGLLWIYDKGKNQIYSGPPTSQASGKDFYSFKGIDGKKTAIIELKVLRKIDADGCVAIETSIDPRNADNRTGEELYVLYGGTNDSRRVILSTP